MTSSAIADQLAELLAPYLGAFNAKISIKTFSQRALGCPAESLAREDVPALLEALRPSLYTLVGKTSTDTLLEKIARQVK